MTEMNRTRARCLEPGCAWRFRSGPDRWCADHQDGEGDLAARLDQYTAAMTAPAGRNGGEESGQRMVDAEGQHGG